jgi:IS5 family transposase
MKLLEAQLYFDFEQPDWSRDPELFVIHQILDYDLNLIKTVANCFPNLTKDKQIGTTGMTLEQVVRCAIYKQKKKLTYRELSVHTFDSKMGIVFMKINNGKGFSHQTLHDNISKITSQVLDKLLVKTCKLALELKLDNGQKMRSDSSAFKTNVHYPTNCSLLWDCVRVCARILKKAKKIFSEIEVKHHQKHAKKLNFKIVNTSGQEKRIPLFKKLLSIQKKYKEQAENAILILKNSSTDQKSDEKLRLQFLAELESLVPKMEKVYDVAYRKEILDEKVPVDEKIFSIFEDHTDLIVKGKREQVFGHKVNFTSGKSNLIFDVIIEKGNPNDGEYYQKTLNNIKENYDLVPRDFSTDGGYASIKNLDFAKEHGIKNIVFCKTKGKMQNFVSSKKMQTMLKKWRAGIEAVISNFKRGLNSRLCNWKGYEKFQSFILWNVITYNLTLIASLLLN